jgi:hypothetical protein
VLPLSNKKYPSCDFQNTFMNEGVTYFMYAYYKVPRRGGKGGTAYVYIYIA